MNDFNKKISGIRETMNEMKAELYVIKNPDLVILDEYNKDLYLKLLATIVQYENNPSDMQILYLKRIVKGIETEKSIEDYMRKALELSADDVTDFIEFAKTNNVKFYFALESILLVNMGDYNEQNMEYVAELMELCGVTKADLEYLSLVAKSVLQQDSTYYDQAKEIITESCLQLNFKPYIENYYVGTITDNQYVISYSSPNKEMSRGIVFKNRYSANKVVFKNMIIYINDEWYINRCENVLFENCEIYGDSYSIILLVCKSVTFKNCKISGFKTYAFISKIVNKLQYINCQFADCMRYINNDSLDGLVIHNNDRFDLNNNIEVKIKNCLFRNCGGKCDGSVIVCENIICNNSCYISNSKFISCWIYDKYNTKMNTDSSYNKIALFADGSKCENNEMIDCAPLVRG